jgi:hypothetical protein
LLHEFNGSGPQQQKLSGSFSLPAPLIDDASKRLEKLRNPVDFIQNDQFILMLMEVEFRVGQFGPVGRQFQIEINGFGAETIGHCVSQSGFANLARPDQDYRWKFVQHG